MLKRSTEKSDQRAAKNGGPSPNIAVSISSFGYKQGEPPPANVVFDVRFLKNPYWVEELRPLTGLDLPVQKYVLEQPAAKDFVESISTLIAKVLPAMSDVEADKFVIAFGCTGGQHRSVALAEAVKVRLQKFFPKLKIAISHREIGGARQA